MLQNWIWTPTYWSVEKGFAKDCQDIILALPLNRNFLSIALGGHSLVRLPVSSCILYLATFFTYLFEGLLPFIFSAYHIVYILAINISLIMSESVILSYRVLGCANREPKESAALSVVSTTQEEAKYRNKERLKCKRQ